MNSIGCGGKSTTTILSMAGQSYSWGPLALVRLPLSPNFLFPGLPCVRHSHLPQQALRLLHRVDQYGFQQEIFFQTRGTSGQNSSYAQMIVVSPGRLLFSTVPKI